MINERAEMLKRRMEQLQREQQLFHIPRRDRDYGKEYEEELQVETLTKWEKWGLVVGVVVVLGLCMWLKPI